MCSCLSPRSMPQGNDVAICVFQLCRLSRKKCHEGNNGGNKLNTRVLAAFITKNLTFAALQLLGNVSCPKGINNQTKCKREKFPLSLIFNAFQHSKISWLRAVHTFLAASSYTLSLLQVNFEPATLLNGAATTPGTSCPTLFRQVCGFFNVPQNFRV